VWWLFIVCTSSFKCCDICLSVLLQLFYGCSGFCPGLPGWASARKVKLIWIYWRDSEWHWHLLGHMPICWAICKSAFHTRQISMPCHFVFIFCCITAVACIFFIIVLRLAVQAIVLIKLELSWVELSAPPLSFFTGQMPFLPPNQQHQSTEDKMLVSIVRWNCLWTIGAPLDDATNDNSFS